MDDADPGLESRTQPVYHPVRGQDASALNPIPFTQNSGHPRTERRFINVLDADREQLPHRLRQMTALLAEQSIDFEQLLGDLLAWNYDSKRTQNTWAREFYRTLTPSPSPSSAELTHEMETAV